MEESRKREKQLLSLPWKKVGRITREQEGERESCRFGKTKGAEGVKIGREMGEPRDMDAVRDHRSDMSGPPGGNGQRDFGSGAWGALGKPLMW